MQDNFYSPNYPTLNRPKMFQTVPKCPNLLPNAPKIHIYPHKTQIDSESRQYTNMSQIAPKHPQMSQNVLTFLICPLMPLKVPKCIQSFINLPKCL